MFTKTCAIAVVITGISLALSSTAPAASEMCSMNPAFDQKDSDAKNQKTSVWANGAVGNQPSALMFVEKINVNTDGTRRSYNVADFWGETVALNNLCNAMSDACSNLDSEGMRQRRILTQRAKAQGWPADLFQATRISPDIIPLKNGKPCPEVDGFLVSATALHKKPIQDACDITNYVDALVTPAIVIPKGSNGFSQRNVRVGDLVVTLRPGKTSPVFAVVGDTGPVNSLGEGSIALNGRLLDKAAPPVNYTEVRGRKEFVGKGWSVPETIVLIFPGTRDENTPYMTPERINAASKKLFEDWGGITRAQACAEEYAK